MNKIKNGISAQIAGCIPSLSADEIFGMLEYPPDKSMGDIALPCFRLSKALRMAPPAIASKIAGAFVSGGDIESVECAGGYLNFRLSEDAYKRILSDICVKGDAYASSDKGAGKTVVLDYSSPNVAKQFHIGHLPSTVIGNSLKNIHEYLGYNCVGVNHLGDWGTQFGKLIVAYKKWGSREKIEELGISELQRIYVKFHEEAASDPSLDDEARAWFTKMENGDAEALDLWKWFREISISEFKRVYDIIGVKFDSYNGEAFYNDKMEPVVDELREKGLLKTDNGASLVDLEEYGMPPCLILKSDGSTLYATRDITAAIYRNDTYHFDKCIYVTAGQQNLHFAQWFKVIELMGYGFRDKLYHVPFGTVSINGEKLSTREGKVVLLADLFDTAVTKVENIIEEKNPGLADKKEVARKVGVGAIIFNFLYNSRIKDVDFNWDEALNFDGNTGPYAQYTYARACSVLEKVGGAKLPGNITVTHRAERDLLLAMAMLPEKVLAAEAQLEPSVITRCMMDVCQAFNGFYHDCSILRESNEDVMATRVCLTEAARSVIGICLKLIGLERVSKI